MRPDEMNNQLYSLLDTLKANYEEVIPETNTVFWSSYRKWKDQMTVLKEIKGHLSKEDAEHLEKYADAATGLYQMENNNAFLTGFKYGFSFANWINDSQESSSFQIVEQEDALM